MNADESLAARCVRVSSVRSEDTRRWKLAFFNYARFDMSVRLSIRLSPTGTGENIYTWKLNSMMLFVKLSIK